MTSLIATSTTSVVPTQSPAPLNVILFYGTDSTSDFFAFDDLARLNTGGSSEYSQDSFSFRELIEDGIDGSQDILLFGKGCEINGGHDCPAACNDTTVFFGSLETFYNCAALASIAYWTKETGAYYIPEEAEKNASALMGSRSLANFDDRPVLNSFVSCAQESCDRDGLSVSCNASMRALQVNKSSAKEIFDAMATFCPSIEAEINPDIFGPGVRAPLDAENMNSLF